MVQKAPSLKGKTVAITRPEGQAEEAGKLIEQKGGKPYFIPAIEIKGLSNSAPIKRFISELQKGQVDYVIFMSTNGVKYLFTSPKASSKQADSKRVWRRRLWWRLVPEHLRSLKKNTACMSAWFL